MMPSKRSKSSGFPPTDPVPLCPESFSFSCPIEGPEPHGSAALGYGGLTLSVLGNGDVQGCDLVYELLALFALGELVGLCGELANLRQELFCISVHESSFP